MELFLDTASVEDIKALNKMLRIDGVTTNPTILTKANKDYMQSIKEIMEILNEDQKLFVEVLANTTEDILKEARYINGLRKNTYAKIPVSKEGLKALKILHDEGGISLATAIFTSTQAYLAAKNGADYLAPYVNRMENYLDGIDETLKLQQTIWNNEFESKVVAASFKNVNQVKQLMINDIDAITISPEICYKMIEHDGTTSAIKGFEDDWQKAYGKKTLL